MKARGGAWKRMGRVNGSDAGRKARKVYRCEGCGLWHYDAKPAQCLSCGRLDFERFDSIGEAKHYANLELQQTAGLITELRRQVPLPLLTVGREGLPIVWGRLIVDYAFKRNGEQIYSDWKPDAGPSPDAVLKIRCLEAQGVIVELCSTRGKA